MKKGNLLAVLITAVMAFAQAMPSPGQSNSEKGIPENIGAEKGITEQSSGGNFQIKQSVIASGGGAIQGGQGGQNGSYKISATIGQPVAGAKMEGFSYSIANGFWNSSASTAVSQARFDFDGDGKADQAVFRPSEGNWYLLRSQAGATGMNFGLANDLLVPGDYDGDGKTDIAVYRGGIWFIVNSSNGAITGGQFGLAGDIPAPGNFDGDTKDDRVVFRPSTGDWYVLKSIDGTYTITHFGQNGDKPVVADYDGDGKTDIALFRPADGNWHIQRSTLGYTIANFGVASDKPVTGDFDGDGKADLTIYRPSQGSWYSFRSSQGLFGVSFGLATDIPAAADYDGDGKMDIAVYRAGAWYKISSSNGQVQIINYGLAGDKPVPAAFIQ